MKQINYIEAERNVTKEVKVYLEDNGNREFETVKDLIETLEKDKQWAEDNNVIDEFLNSKVSLQLADIEGQIVTGDMNLSVGLCGDKMILTGNIQSIDFIKRNK